jgi:sugar/nucleoside kinase (ribokinase family)
MFSLPPDATPPHFSLVTFSVILDDIVLPDGATRMAWLGGGGPQTCFGAQLFQPGESDQPATIGIASGVGRGFDPDWFVQSHIDINGLRVHATLPTMRAWQIIEEDEHRTQVWRVPMQAVGVHLNRSLDLLPPAYHHAQAFHLGIHPDHPDIDFMQSVADLPHRPLISVEVFKGADVLPTREQLERWLPLCGVFSANAAEAVSLGAPEDERAAAHWLLDHGARMAIVRLGRRGSLIADGAQMVHVPALPVQPVLGSVGAGNAYCGAFVVELLRHGDLTQAGRAGSVAAKLLIEQERLPVVDAAIRRRAQELMAQFA